MIGANIHRKPYLLAVISMSLGLFSMQFAMAGVSIDSAGIVYPDGNLQSVAYKGAYQSPDEVFHSGCKVTSTTATSVGRCQVERTIPSGKRLVIETVTGGGYADYYVLGSAYLGIWAENGSDTGSLYIKNSFPWVTQDNSISSRRFFGFNHSVHLYVDGPATLQFDAMGAAASGAGYYYSVEYAVSGYLVDALP